jgi:hypothetical protein
VMGGGEGGSSMGTFWWVQIFVTCVKKLSSAHNYVIAW